MVRTRRPPMLLLLLLALSGVAHAGDVDAALSSGERFHGLIAAGGDVDAVIVEAAAGETLVGHFTAAKGKGLRGRVALIDMSTSAIVAQEDAAKRKLTVHASDLPSTGSYRWEVSGLNGTTGTYALRSDVVRGKDLAHPTSQPGVGAPGSVRVPFDAAKGSRFSAKLFRVKGTTGQAGAPTLVGPFGPVDLAPYLSQKKAGFRVATLELPETGAYELQVDNVGDGGSVEASTRALPPKRSKERQTESVGQVGFVLTDSEAREPDGPHAVELRLTLLEGDVLPGPLVVEVGVDPDVKEFVATPGSDYSPLGKKSRVTFPKGSTDDARKVVVFGIQDDLATEGTEAIPLVLTNVGGWGGAKAGASHLVILVDDEFSGPVIGSFAVDTQQIDLGDEVTFTWTVTNAELTPVKVFLDAEDDGNKELVLSDFSGTAQFTHTYKNGVTFSPVLIMTDDNGMLLDWDTLQVDVDGPGLSFLEPAPDSITGDGGLFVHVVNQGGVYGVEATIGNTTSPLVDHPFSGGFWYATVPFLVAPGEHEIIVTAVDAFLNTLEIRRRFTFDFLPELDVIEPAPHDVATPSIRVLATATDLASTHTQVTVTTSPPSSIPMSSDQDTLDVMLDLSDSAPASSLELKIKATDEQGLSHTESIPVWLEPTLTLVGLEKAPGRILDANEDALLFTVPLGNGESLGLLDRTTFTTTTIPLPGAREVYAEGTSLTPQGAIVMSRPAGVSGNYEVHELRHGLLSLWSADGFVFQVAENYATWLDGSTFLRHEFSKEIDLAIPFPGFTAKTHHLSPTGHVTYAKSPGAPAAPQVFQFHDGLETQVTDETAATFSNPESDGEVVVYVKSLGGSPGSVMMLDSGEETLLRAPTPTDLELSFEVSGGWVAFRRPGTLGQEDVWLRDPTGLELQVSAFASSSQIVQLAPDGELVIRGPLTLQLWSGGLLDTLCASSAGVRKLDGAWHTYLGNRLFRRKP